MPKIITTYGHNVERDIPNEYRSLVFKDWETEYHSPIEDLGIENIEEFVYA